MLRIPALLAAAIILCGCSSDEVTTRPAPSLERVHVPDADLVEQGRRAFADYELMQGVLPPLAMRNIYIAWSDNLSSLYTYYTDEDAYWLAFNERYGTAPSPFEGAIYPAGFAVAEGGDVGIDCLLCHAGQLRDDTIIGLANNRLDLRGFVEDLQALPAAVEALKMRDLPAQYDALVQAIPDTMVPEPYASIAIPTGAAGVNDGFGLGLLTSKEYGDPPADLETFMGYQDPQPWWTLAYRYRTYSDGAGNADGIYTMMSTLLAFGLSYAELATYIPTFVAIRNYQCALEPPSWPDDFPAIDVTLADTGADIFAAQCASCHGAHEGDRWPAMLVSPSEIGTDPLRADSFGTTEADWFNSFIPEERYEMTTTGSYLAPALVGIWASAPYLHNGSVPTLRALLDHASRPTRWRRVDADYDAEAIGLPFETVDAPTDRDTIEGRKVVDTTVVGMSNAGHAFELSPEEIEALLAFLKTL